MLVGAKIVSTRLAVCLTIACAALLAAVSSRASAEVASPAWSISSVAEPTIFNAAETQDTVQQFTVKATGGTYEVWGGSIGSNFPTAPISWNESASGLRERLEAVPQMHAAGNIEVEAGVATATEHTYTITWMGAWSGNGVDLLSLSEYTAANLVNGAGVGRVTDADTQVGKAYDRYTITATNIGSVASSGAVKIVDTLPTQLSQEQLLNGARVEERPGGRTSECTLAPPVTVTCEYNASEHPVAPGNKLIVVIDVAVPSASLSGVVVNEATVSGGGGQEASTSETTAVNAGSAPFGVDQFSFEANGLDGETSLQAAGHPYAVTATISLNTDFTGGVNGGGFPQAAIPPQEAKTISIELPLGLAGNPLAAERCPEVEMNDQIGGTESGRTACPAGSIVGDIRLTAEGTPWSFGPFPLYNVVPEHGYPAEFGFNYAGFGQPIFLYATLVPSPSGYRVRVTTPAAPRALNLDVERVAVTIFGNAGAQDGLPGDPAFVRNATSCSGGPLSAKLEVASWEGSTASQEAVAYPHVQGCGLLQGASVFNPSISVEPEVSQADSPSGYQVDVRIPQAPNVFGGLATPDLQNAVVTLPAGVSLSPSLASGAGLVGCSEGQIDLSGTELGEGHAGGDGSPYDDGLVHASPGHCPAGSQLGTVEAVSPVLSQPLRGHVYLATPSCGGEGQAACTEAAAEEGKVVRLYVEVAGAGVIVKQAGSVEVGGYGGRNDLAVGQVRATFDGIPQQPLEELKFDLSGGQRTPLANPQTCGTATTTSDFRPWSAPESGPDATPSSRFQVTGCPGGGLPFTPGFSAGSVQTRAGGFTPFEVTLSRRDGEQDLGRVSVTLPPGVAGVLAKVTLCEEAQAQAGTCPAASRIGTARVAAGAGTQPLWLTGQVYLTGPYKGAPFGLSVVVPAQAGPYNLGNVVVRAAISVNPTTAQVTVASDAFPQAVDGIPVRIKTVNVSIDREGFTFNPTNCDALHVTGTVTADMPDGTSGATVSVGSPFAASGCAGLPFHPSFTASTQSKTTKQSGASLDVKYTSGAGQANTAKVAVTLPKELPSQLKTIQQACPEATFAANPASCPAGSDIGTATASTPILANPVSGPAYLVSHGGAEFPNLVLILQGDGVTVDLVGSINIKGDVTSSTFASVPDVPITTFELKLPQGPHAALTAVLPKKAKGSLCGQSLVMPTVITGQNGAQITQQTKIKPTGCTVSKKKKHTKKHKHKTSKHAKGGKKHG